MLLTKPQQLRFWREWQAVIRHQGWTNETPDQITIRRRRILESCGFLSLTAVDRAAGFDRVLAQLGLLRDNIAKTWETDAPQIGQRRRLLWQISQLTESLSAPYADAIARDRFGTTPIPDLNLKQLVQLRNTLNARLQSKRREYTDHISSPSVPDPVPAECPF